jgi:hypothetical protein
MRDSDQDYPIHQPQDRNNRAPDRPFDDFEDQDEPELEEREPRPPYRGRQRPAGAVHQRDVATTPMLPLGGVKNALIVGAIAGILCAAQSIVITLANASTYQAYHVAKQDTVKNALAFTIFGYAALTFAISLLILLIAGFVAGKIIVQRRLVFLEGFVAGLITYGISFVTNLIPNYPGAQQTGSGAANTGDVTIGILLILVSFLVWGIIGGLVSLLGGWIATRKHPYYVGY